MNSLTLVLFSLATIPTQLFAFETAVLDSSSKDGFVIGLNDSAACVLSDSGLKCWGDLKNDLANIPELQHPRQIAMGMKQFCALDAQGVKCWGSPTEGQMVQPQLQNPRFVTSGVEHTCAIDDTGVKCWGSNRDTQMNRPVFTHPEQIAAGAFHTCALESNTVKCWGSNSRQQLNVPKLRNPVQIYAGAYHSCAVDDSGLVCWGVDSIPALTQIPMLHQPKKISTGGTLSCALQQNDVQCWGYDKSSALNVPKLRMPTQVATGWDTVCAIDEDGIKCWGAHASLADSAPEEVRNLRRVFFDIYNLESSYSRSSHYVYRDKKAVLEGLTKVLAQIPVDSYAPLFPSYRKGLARLFSIYAIEPLFLETTSQIVTENVLPNLTAAKSFWSQRFGVQDIHGIDLSNDILSVIFVVLETNIKSAKTHMSDDNKQQADALLLTVAQIKASKNKPAVTAASLSAALSSHQSLMTAMLQDQSTVGFAKSIIEVQGYISQKVL